VRRYAKQIKLWIIEPVIKYIHLFINILVVFAHYLGVQTKDIFIALSSITTVVGVAMFAQWSIF
jgi:hypothetical protein